jgi:hypothetical protein
MAAMNTSKPDNTEENATIILGAYPYGATGYNPETHEYTWDDD